MVETKIVIIGIFREARRLIRLPLCQNLLQGLLKRERRGDCNETTCVLFRCGDCCTKRKDGKCDSPKYRQYIEETLEQEGRYLGGLPSLYLRLEGGPIHE